uniref:Uncharacterized protein n=1 Tax=Nicotiana tabacum TaxID=4097 RepID=A0A1S4D7P8_TOBAC|nr:PREDICTED: uncharacterized protein LOC107826886 [Nicotiana tabacum]
MSNLSKLEFVALDISGKNYLSWVLDAVIHLAAKGLGDTITQAKDPFELWTGLKERYDHLKATILLRARYEWMHLQLQDFKTSAVRRFREVHILEPQALRLQSILCGPQWPHRNRNQVCAIRKDGVQRVGILEEISNVVRGPFCGVGLAPIRDVMNDEDLLEKTLTTFHASNMVLQQQYRERGFKKYYELISCLLVVEQHNTLLLKNHEDRPTGSAPLPEVSTAARRDMSRKRQNNNHGYMNVRGHANGKRRYNSRHRDELGKGVAAECEHLQEKLRSMQSEMD